MTSISAAKLLMRFENYLAGVFHPIPEERVVAGAIQSFYGWVFPFLRNAFICGVLKYLADASGSLTLQTLAFIACVVVVGYCLSYIIEGALTPCQDARSCRPSADAITAALAPAGRAPTLLRDSGRRLVGARCAVATTCHPAHGAPLAGPSRLR